MCGYRLRVLERATVQQMGRNPGGSEDMATGGRAEGGFSATFFDHSE
jgi:hypothetical protein